MNSNNNFPAKKPPSSRGIRLSFGRRLAIFLALMAISLTALGYSLTRRLSIPSGWREITVQTSLPTPAGKFHFFYDLPSQGAQDTYRALTGLYTDTMEEASVWFDKDHTADDVFNLASLSASPSSGPLVLPHALYQALKDMEEAGNRSLYLAPVYEQYNTLFHCTEDFEARNYDPHLNPELSSSIREVLSFVGDPDHIHLIFDEEKEAASLYVSPEYQAYASSNGQTAFLDLSWMTNAFILDLVGSRLREAGLTDGFITTDEGFGLCLDTRGTLYTLALPEEENASAAPPDDGLLDYQGPLSLITYRAFPADAKAFDDYYYVYEDGRICTGYISPEDGLSKEALASWAVYSPDLSVSGLLLRTAPVYISDVWDEEAARALAEDGIFSAWHQDGQVITTES